MVVFPGMVTQLFVGRERSIFALDSAMSNGQEIFLTAQKSPKKNEPLQDDLHEVGTIGTILQLLRVNDGMKVLVEGRARARVAEFIDNKNAYFDCVLADCLDQCEQGTELEALQRQLHTTFVHFAKLSRKIQPEIVASIEAIEDLVQLSDAVSAHVPGIKLHDRQSLLEECNIKNRLEKLIALIGAEMEILQVERKIKSRVKKQIDRSQKEFYLNEQMQAIQKELGSHDEWKSEFEELEEKLKDKVLSQEAETKVRREMRKLKMMNPTSSEAAVIRNYIDWVLAMPWGEYSTDSFDFSRAERVLDADHYGLTKIKQRILEHIAVSSISRRVRGSILCFAGPPGVGKTSLCRSIARAMGRKYVRIALGGVRDEAEIRGHRRTYIGAMPGKIIQSIRKVGVNNPVFCLDEVDKMSSDFRGDPASALLETLDPEQNNAFGDHFLDVDYDLSKVLFICTANSVADIPLALQDRMEVLQLTGYTDLEKRHIARNYLIPKSMLENGIAPANEQERPPPVRVEFNDDAIMTLIRSYTREAGVRSLEREIASICRKIVHETLRGDRSANESMIIDSLKVTHYLGPLRHVTMRAHSNQPRVGVSHGLAVTSAGGEVLPCEVATLTGKGRVHLTGKMGSVMQESAEVAWTYVRSQALALGLAEDFFTKISLHVHMPEGAVPKDGPSAGITMAAAMASAVTQMPVLPTIAMTGELTLTGRVLEIGGLKEKCVAATRSGFETIVAPKANQRERDELGAEVLDHVRLVFVESMEEVLQLVLVGYARAKQEALGEATFTVPTIV
jgi:ATP-dependent Lon protease